MTKRTNLRVIREIDSLRMPLNWTDLSVGGFRLDRVSLDDEPGAIPIIILGRILSSPKIFNQAAFQIEIKLLSEYPFKAPEVRFVKKIYHPNVDSDGKICDQLLYEGEEHKPTTPLLYIIKRIAFLIDNPKLDHAVNHEIAVEYEFNRPEFNRKASELVKLVSNEGGSGMLVHAAKMALSLGVRTAILLSSRSSACHWRCIGDANFLSSCELYDLLTSKWTTIDGMPEKRSSHTTMMLKSGKILATAG